jgi:hypothetical protein
MEDKERGEQDGTALPDDVKDRQARLEEALAQLTAQGEQGERSKRADQEKQTINLTDPDSRIMSRRNGGSIQGTTGRLR